MDNLENTTIEESTESQVDGESSQEDQSVAESQDDSSQQDAASETSEPKEVPFHEHPRFKELIQEKNTYKQQYSQLENAYRHLAAQLQEMQNTFQAQSQVKQQQPTYEKTLERLKGIDPEFAEFQSKLYEDVNSVPQLQKELQEFRQWKQQVEVENLRTQATSRLEQLYNEHKVTPELKDYYREYIANRAYENPKAGLQELDAYFKEAHEKYSKLLDSVKRQERASYVSEKKKDGTPATQTGGQPAAIANGKSLDNLESKIKAVSEALRSGKQLI